MRSTEIDLIIKILFEIIVLLIIVIIFIFLLSIFANFGTLNYEYKNVFSELVNSINSGKDIFVTQLDYNEQEYDIVFNNSYVFVYNCQYQTLNNHPALYFNTFGDRALEYCYLVYSGKINKNYNVSLQSSNNNYGFINSKDIFNENVIKATTNNPTISLNYNKMIIIGEKGSLSNYLYCNEQSLAYGVSSLLASLASPMYLAYNAYNYYSNNNIREININNVNFYAISANYLSNYCIISEKIEIIVRYNNGIYDIIFKM